MDKTGAHYNCTVSYVFDLEYKIANTRYTVKYFYNYLWRWKDEITWKVTSSADSVGIFLQSFSVQHFFFTCETRISRIEATILQEKQSLDAVKRVSHSNGIFAQPLEEPRRASLGIYETFSVIFSSPKFSSLRVEHLVTASIYISIAVSNEELEFLTGRSRYLSHNPYLKMRKSPLLVLFLFGGRILEINLV